MKFKIKVNDDGTLMLSEKNNFDVVLEGIYKDIFTSTLKPVTGTYKGVKSFFQTPSEAEIADQTTESIFSKGGSITFSVDVTGNPYEQFKDMPNDEVAKRRGVDVRNTFETLLNRINKNKKINIAIESALKRAKERGLDLNDNFSLSAAGVGAWTDLMPSGKKEKKTERSYILTFEGLPIDVIEDIALEILNLFKQQGVLIKDFETGKRYLYNATRKRLVR